ncbi:HEAT repeat domain-containing protein [Bdellovibrionota bacterium FG-1]
MSKLWVKVCVWAIATILFGLSMPVSASTDAEIEESVRVMIMDRHPHESPAWWRSLGPQTPKILTKMYETEPSTYRKMRLIEGLSAFTDDAVAVDFIKSQAEHTPDDVIRTNAIRMIGVAQGAREEEWLSKFLKHDDPHTRVAAGTALKRSGSSSALARVEQWFVSEKQSWVVAKVKGELPPISGKWVPSGTSEDRLSPDFGGTWRGFWVSVKEGTVGMKSEPVLLTAQVSGLSEFNAEVTVKSQHKIRHWKIVKAIGKAGYWTGSMAEEQSKNPVRVPSQVCNADLSKRSENVLMQIRLPQSGEFILLRRDNALQD